MNFKNIISEYLREKKENSIKKYVDSTVICQDENHDFFVLLIKRGAEPGKGKWAVPGGHLKNDESIKQGIIRELQEETSLKLDKPKFITLFRVKPKRGLPECEIYNGVFVANDKLSLKSGDDAKEAKWFSLDYLPNKEEMLGDSLTILKKQLKKILKTF